MKKILFTDCTFSQEEIDSLKAKGIEILPEHDYLGEEALIEKLKTCQGYVIGGGDKATQKVIEYTNLDVIIFYGTGYENYIDIPAAKAKGVKCGNTPKANAYTVAEHAVALILDAVKKISHLNSSTKQGKWLRRQAWNLQGKTLGVVGMGTIGGFVARIMHQAFQMKVVYTSRSPKPEMENELGAGKVELDELMKISDVVAVHASYGEDTVGIIGEKQLALMKPTAVLINTSRAELVDAGALKKALETGKLATAAFDSYYKEPVPETTTEDKWGLMSLPDDKFILTPHTAYSSKEAVENMNQMVKENLLAYVEGKDLPYSVI